MQRALIDVRIERRTRETKIHILLNKRCETKVFVYVKVKF